MNIYSPRHVIVTNENTLYEAVPYRDLLTNKDSFIPIFVDGSLQSHSTASYFKETKGRILNDCCHAKLTSAIGLVPDCTNTNVTGGYNNTNADALQSGICHTFFNGTTRDHYAAWVAHLNNTNIYRFSFIDQFPFKSTIFVSCEVRKCVDPLHTSGRVDLQEKFTGWFLSPVVSGTELTYSIAHTTNPSIGGLDTLLGSTIFDYVTSCPKKLLTHYTIDEIIQIISDIVGLCEAHRDLIDFWDPNVSYPIEKGDYFLGHEYRFPVVGAQDYAPPEINLNSFLFNEPECIFTDIPQWLIPNTFQSYWVNWGINHAFINACDDVPILNSNSLQNIFEVVSFAKSLIIDHKIKIPKRLSDAWLAYRYQLGTSTMDVQDAIQFMHRHMPTGFSDSIKTYGQETYFVDDCPVTVRCCIEIKPKILNTLDEIWTTLYKYGLQPNFYVLWDSIPLSFVVDWFIPIGDSLEASDAEQYMEETYEILSQDYSLSYSHNIDGYSKVHCYSRWRNDFIKLDPLYWFDKKPTSNKTHIFRFFDGVSLLIGHK